MNYDENFQENSHSTFNNVPEARHVLQDIPDADHNRYLKRMEVGEEYMQPRIVDLVQRNRPKSHHGQKAQIWMHNLNNVP
jgi:hypothetical protein